MELKRNDGQPSLRAKLAAGFSEQSMLAQQAEAEATLRLLELRQLEAGRVVDIHAGDTVYRVEIKES